MNCINNKYAPGVATYGAPGAQGNSGKDGYSIFYVPNDNINDENIKNSIIKNKYITNNSRHINFVNEIDRKYQINDLFLTRSGKLYKLIKFDENNDPIFDCVNENFLPHDTSILNYFEGTIYNKVGQRILFSDAASISDDVVNNFQCDGVVNVIATNDGTKMLSLYNYDRETETSSELNVHVDTSCFIFNTEANICIDNLKSSTDQQISCVTVNNKNYYSPIINNVDIECSYNVNGSIINIDKYNGEFITVYIFDDYNSYQGTVYAKNSSIDISKYTGRNFIVAANNGNYVSKILEKK